MITSTSSYSVLGTLGDSEGFLTCSMHVAKEWDHADQIRAYPLFETAAEDLRSEKIDCLLVPAAYPHLGRFIMDRDLKAAESFIRQIPALVLGGMESVPSSSTEQVYHHPATTHLLSEIDTEYQETVGVASNSEACRRVLENPQSSVCITNQLCADYYGLSTYKILREGIRMPWICFTKMTDSRLRP
ncbi:hypothetical protein F4V43_03515 [Paenibacillus spiritus]|uniref:Prephenate dehydratase n=1 Tax=Paenibacillus spiritus TaxID=2496557 RepID=A0A5J5GH75_9BACL|nr:hypothetical protein [Paenibacillus spiritus]KAA9007569.1 hypothetical protein F4V43_03515 [Paenibacillus spiritus]